MESTAVPRVNLQVVGGTNLRRGSNPARVKPKHLTRSTVNIAAYTFAQMQSADDAADSIKGRAVNANGAGITGKTVIECVRLNLMRRVERFETDNGTASGLAA